MVRRGRARPQARKAPYSARAQDQPGSPNRKVACAARGQEAPPDSGSERTLRSATEEQGQAPHRKLNDGKKRQHGLLACRAVGAGGMRRSAPWRVPILTPLD